MLDPATARLCVWRLPLEAAFRLFSKLGSLGGSIRERFSRTGRTRPALARPHSHGGFLKMIVCESGGHANGLTYFIFRFLRRPQIQKIDKKKPNGMNN